MPRAGVDYPEDFGQFQDWFATDEACFEDLARLRWPEASSARSAAARSPGAHAPGLQRVLGLKSYETAWAWMHKLRRAMVRPERELLSGLVEVDESFIGGVHRDMPGLGLDKISVLIAAEQFRAPRWRNRFENRAWRGLGFRWVLPRGECPCNRRTRALSQSGAHVAPFQ